MQTLQDVFTVSTAVLPELKDSPTLLPKWKQKLVDVNMFDPNDVYFRGSAHMPLLGFLGNVPRRSERRLLAREQARKEKRNAKQSSGDATGHQPPWSWSGSWQPSSWTYGNASTWQPYDTCLHGQVAQNHQWHSSSYDSTPTWQPVDIRHGQAANNDQWHSWTWNTMD